MTSWKSDVDDWGRLARVYIDMWHDGYVEKRTDGELENVILEQITMDGEDRMSASGFFLSTLSHGS